MSLLFVGPVVVFITIEVFPHLLNPCLVSGSMSICDRTADGVDVHDRWHLLHHTLLGALPMIALCRMTLQRYELLPRKQISKQDGSPANSRAS